MFKNPFSFEGRIRRTEYVLSIIIIYVVILSVGYYNQINKTDNEIFLLILIPIYWFKLAQGAKRCHDRGNSGWYQIIPFYGLWMIFADSDEGTNEYGSNPKGIVTEE